MSTTAIEHEISYCGNEVSIWWECDCGEKGIRYNRLLTSEQGIQVMAKEHLQQAQEADQIVEQLLSSRISDTGSVVYEQLSDKAPGRCTRCGCNPFSVHENDVLGTLTKHNDEWLCPDCDSTEPAPLADGPDCELPPLGYACKLRAGHKGPCPTYEVLTADVRPPAPEINVQAIDCTTMDAYTAMRTGSGILWRDADGNVKLVHVRKWQFTAETQGNCPIVRVWFYGWRAIEIPAYQQVLVVH